MPKQKNFTKIEPLKSNANFKKRLLAFIYDAFILMAVLFIAGLLYAKLFGLDPIERNSPYFIFYQLYLCLCVLCFNGFFYAKSGQTIGMRAWNLKLVDNHNQATNIKKIISRLFWASLLLPIFGIGFWSMLFDNQKKCWYDKLSNTKIISL